jgi:hypothetical protein
MAGEMALTYSRIASAEPRAWAGSRRRLRLVHCSVARVSSLMLLGRAVSPVARGVPASSRSLVRAFYVHNRCDHFFVHNLKSLRPLLVATDTADNIGGQGLRSTRAGLPGTMCAMVNPLSHRRAPPMNARTNRDRS